MVHIWTLPDYWYWFPIGILVVCLICGIKWRNHWRGILATLALVTVLFYAIAWIPTWRTRVSFGFTSRQPKSDGMVEHWNFSTVLCHGQFQAGFDGYQFPPQIMAEYGPRSIVWGTQYDYDRSPQWENEKVIITNSDFIQQTLGFQICWAGFTVPAGETGMRGAYSITIPFWFAIPVCAIFALPWLWRTLRRRHRIRHGLCLLCGFDLRASVGKCPECGAPIPPRKATAPSEVPSPVK